MQTDKIPAHIAIIMDGNGRWAKKRGKPRTFGHKNGATTLRRIVGSAQKIGIKYLSVYAFSTENWKRPNKEVNFLMKLLKNTIITELNDFVAEKAIKIRFLGDIAALPSGLQLQIKKAEEKTTNTKGMQLNIMLNYGSRKELVNAVNCLIKKGVQEITENNFSNHLYTKDIPDPDLLIRTSGELRISNFLLWQLAYTELWFTDKYWPDFNEEDLLEAIKTYQKRNRRFGTI